MKTIVSMGRGGTGKTSFAALMTKYFIEAGRTPLLLIDADPDQNLGEMVGVDLKEEGKMTLSELVVATFIEGGGTLVGVPPSERVESKIWETALYEGKHFDLMAIGEKWVEGCYCLPNASLKDALENLTEKYSTAIIDSPAGLEHLNRRISSRVDDIFDLIDPSNKSFNHVKRAFRIAKEVKIEFRNFYVVGGYRLLDQMSSEVETRTGLRYLGKIVHDEEVEHYVMNGRSLLELPSTSMAYDSVRRILNRAGY